MGVFDPFSGFLDWQCLSKQSPVLPREILDWQVVCFVSSIIVVDDIPRASQRRILLVVGRDKTVSMFILELLEFLERAIPFLIIC